MANIKIEKNRYTTESLYQWDKNQTLTVYGLSLPTTPEIHFTTEAMSRAIVRNATMDESGVITVDVPNSLLQKPYKITAYICLYGEDGAFRSQYQIVIPVVPRNKPSDYSFEYDGEVYSFDALENKVADAVDKLNTLPTIIANTIAINELGFWVINGVTTNVRARGIDGENFIREQSTGRVFRVFMNTRAWWNNYDGDKTDALFIPTDDDTLEVISEEFEGIKEEFESIKEDFDGLFTEDGSSKVQSAEQADNASKINDLELVKDEETGLLKIGDLIIPYKQTLWSGEQIVSSEDDEDFKEIEPSTPIVEGDVLEIEFARTYYHREYAKFKIKSLDSAPQGYLLSCSTNGAVYTASVFWQESKLCFNKMKTKIDGQVANTEYYTIYSIRKIIE